MAEVKIGDDEYQVFKLSGMDQFHVFRRVSPLLRSIGEGFTSLPPEVLDKGLEGMTEGEVLKALEPIIDALGGMEDSDLNYVIYRCLARAQMRTASGQWAAVMPSPGQFQFADKVDMRVIFQLTVAVLQESGVLSFFTAAPESPSPGAPSP